MATKKLVKTSGGRVRRVKAEDECVRALWPYLHADLINEEPRVRAELLQKLRRFFCFVCGANLQEEGCECGSLAVAPDRGDRDRTLCLPGHGVRDVPVP